MNDNGFRQLRVYNEAIERIAEVYLLLQQFPREEVFALSNQIRRAAVSVTSNIAEGSSRSSRRDFAHFLEIAYCSLLEVRSQMDVALRLHYITTEDHLKIDNRIETIS